eukprot:CCRYP_014558-RA/>CCRYP_014558-RA protein AED:0.04 eAED:0.04 QI:51/1/1/1/1/1/2/40/525
MSSPTPSTSASPTARKLLTKLSPLLSSSSTCQSSSTFSESQQTIASWMIFNRKKKDSLAEGMVIAVREAAASKSDDAADRLLVLLKIVHRVLVSNCPAGGGDADVSMWEKSAPLRHTMAEKVLPALLNDLAATAKEEGPCVGQVEDMIKSWKEQNVCDDSFDWDNVTQKWEHGLRNKGGPSQNNDTDAAVTESTLADKSAKDQDDDGISANDENQVNVTSNNTSKETSSSSPVAQTDTIAAEVDTPTTEDKADEASSPDVLARKFSRQDSTMSVASVGDIDYEGVEEAKVEPIRFLEASKIISQLQITRDIGGDTAMNISSILGHITPDVEETCRTIIQQKEQQTGDDKDSTNPLQQHAETLGKLPDDFLDLDLKYARQSLQTYKEVIRQQKRARLQCLHLLLQSRCSFGSMEAARILFGREQKTGDADDNAEDQQETSIPNINVILDKLKKRKEALSDAMALEGLDVEEDAEEEKKLEKEEKEMLPLNWFTEQLENETKGGESGSVKLDDCLEDEPAAKKLKNE